MHLVLLHFFAITCASRKQQRKVHRITDAEIRCVERLCCQSLIIFIQSTYLTSSSPFPRIDGCLFPCHRRYIHNAPRLPINISYSPYDVSIKPLRLFDRANTPDIPGCIRQHAWNALTQVTSQDTVLHVMHLTLRSFHSLEHLSSVR